MPPGDKDPHQASAVREPVADIFENALAQRPKFHLRLDPKLSTLQSLSGSLESFNATHAVIELTSVSGASQSWIGGHADVYFEIVDRKSRKSVFHSFRSRIDKIAEKEGGRVFLHFVFPAALDRSQRRNSIRVRAGLEHFETLSLWRYGAQGDIDLDNPFLELGDFMSGQVRLEDISAGGLRLVFSRGFAGGELATLTPGTRFIVLAGVKGEHGPGEPETWLIARVRSVYENPATKTTSAGFEYIAEGKITPERKIVWKRVTGNVVENVGSWTYAWYLQQSRGHV